MIKGKTSTGFEFEVDPEVLEDMEYIELAADTQDNPALYPRFVEFTLGEEQKKALYDHVRSASGRVLVSKVSAEFTEIINILSEKTETKN